MIEYDFTNIISYIAKSQNIENCKPQFKSASSKGDGYMGTVKAVSLVGSNKTLNLVFKYRDPGSSDGLPLDIAFQNEIYFYKVLFPSFRKFQVKHNILKPFNNTPTYYGSEENLYKELLVMEDLKHRKFDLWNRMQEMNEKHLKYAWKVLAKFHATSFAMKYLDPQLYNNLSDKVTQLNSFNKLMNAMKYYKQVSAMIFNLLDIFNPILEKIYFDKFKSFAENLEEVLPEIINTQDKYDVIAHGDCWCNNMMYQYEDLNNRTVPIDMKLLDFQMARICSPVFDLVYYFYTSVSSKILIRLDDFLRFYHSKLAEYLKCYNLDVEKIFSWETFLEKWRINVKYGLITAILIRRLMLVENGNAPDITKDTDSFLSKTVFDRDTEVLYMQQIKILVIHFVDNYFI